MAQLTGSVFLIDSMQTRQADILDRNECSKSSWAFETWLASLTPTPEDLKFYLILQN